MLYLANAFALQMLEEPNVILTVRTLNIDQAKELLDEMEFHSVVGHQDTANVFSNLLGMDIRFNRESITLGDRDALLVGQVTGGRLPEGATKLPEGATISWKLVIGKSFEDLF